MKVFSIIILVICCIYSFTCLRFFVVLLYHHLTQKKLNKFSTQEKHEFYILLPALREQNILYKTIEHFNSMNYDRSKLHICIITTQREDFEYQQKQSSTKTTQALTEEYLKKNNTNFETINIHYPFEKGNKASQLNYALKNLIDQRGLKNCYFAIFDFDSRPEKDYFEKANKLIAMKKSPDLIQSIPLFVRNIDVISKHSSNLILLQHAMEQACRSGNIEIWRLMVNSSKLLAPIYAMGASLIIKQEALIEQDFIPEPVDDIPLGFRYFINKKRFCYLPSIVLGDMPEKTKQIFNQSILIQKGNLLAFKEIFRKGTAHFTFTRRMLILYEFFAAFVGKQIMPLIMLIYLCLSITSPNFIFLFIIILPYLRFISGSIITLSLSNKHMKLSNYLLALVLCFIHPFCLMYGPNMVLLKEIKRKFSRKEIVYKKTER